MIVKRTFKKGATGSRWRESERESKLKEGCRDGANRGAGGEQGEGFTLKVIASP